MPRVVLFREASGIVPILGWLDGLTVKARAYYQVSTDRLREFGHELRRPEADYLTEGIYELRFRCEGLNYRILYFFHGRDAVVLSHGFVKQQARVPTRELALARRRKLDYFGDPARHGYGEA
jgi:phage-related protein